MYEILETQKFVYIFHLCCNDISIYGYLNVAKCREAEEDIP